eukprot:CAMPEP_0173459142 /NCGR_PEP_ID=MMETSP1357-20121228/60881_1 /TAXON_ID=77926 /ORGANISM="Hemiselmis rufescens, Strain PCC563" /LENGTH=262 /DNA_ID=CAMNT_0014426571 /DNA_START=1 /DNA_END=786 /DNA_ORIENTATION=-
MRARFPREPHDPIRHIPGVSTDGRRLEDLDAARGPGVPVVELEGLLELQLLEDLAPQLDRHEGFDLDRGEGAVHPREARRLLGEALVRERELGDEDVEEANVDDDNEQDDDKLPGRGDVGGGGGVQPHNGAQEPDDGDVKRLERVLAHDREGGSEGDHDDGDDEQVAVHVLKHAPDGVGEGGELVADRQHLHKLDARGEGGDGVEHHHPSDVDVGKVHVPPPQGAARRPPVAPRKHKCVPEGPQARDPEPARPRVIGASGGC